MQTSTYKGTKKENQTIWSCKDKLRAVYNPYVRVFVPYSLNDVHFVDHTVLKAEKQQWSETNEI